MPNDLWNRELLNSHWGLVIGVALVFLMVQLALCIAFCFRMRRQERAVKRLSRDLKQGGDGRRGVRTLSRKHTWLHWVDSSFPADSTQASANLTREDALQELDTRIASNGNYLLLQRMGVMAPLLGVVLTVAGFYWLHVGEDDQSLQTILLAVSPLVSGVGAGAVLALINQGLLHIAGRRVESLRMTARSWFDAVIWKPFPFDTQTGTLKAVQVMENFIRSTLDDIERLSDTLSRAAEMSVVISSLPDEIRTILDRKLQVDHNGVAKSAGGRFVTRLPARPR